jgi:hypothetical protein
MTERKPPGMKTQDWVEAQIKQAQARGEFDDLPGAGKPIPKLADPHDPDWWVKDLIRRENIDTDALLPPSVQLRKEKEQIPDKVAKMRTEREVREYLQELNKRILIQIRDATGIVVPVGTVDEEHYVEQWSMDRPPAEPRQLKPEQTQEAKRSFWRRMFSA